MFDIGDLFQWVRFITPSIIKIFYWLAVIIAVLAGVQAVVAGLRIIFADPIAAVFAIVAGLLVAFVGVIFARIGAEFILIVFRINEHLGAIRGQGEQHQ